MLHLHHLTPLNAAAALAAPGVPVVGHLHGTELMMLEAIERGAGALGARRGVGRSACGRGRRAASGSSSRPATASARWSCSGIGPTASSRCPTASTR